MSEPTPSASDSYISATRLAPRLVLTTFIGRSTLVLAETACVRFEALLETMDRPVWLSDARRLTGFEPRSLAVGPRWFRAFKQRGGQDCLVISEWSGAILAATTTALGLGIRIHNFATLEEGMSAADTLLDER